MVAQGSGTVDNVNVTQHITAVNGNIKEFDFWDMRGAVGANNPSLLGMYAIPAKPGHCLINFL